VTGLFAMLIDQDVYLAEMGKLLADAKERLLAEWPAAEVYTVSIWTDPNAAISAVSFDTLDNSTKRVRQSNEWNKKWYEKYMAEGDTETAELFPPWTGRNKNPADFLFSNIAKVEHRSFTSMDEAMRIAGGDTPIGGPVWRILESLLRSAQERARLLYRDLRLHHDARIAINSPEAWYDHELPMAGSSPIEPLAT